MWSERCKEQLNDCFEETDWDIVSESFLDADELTHAITSYVKFCEDFVFETKTVQIFPNSHSWVSKELKICLNERKIAFCTGNTELLCEKRRTLRRKDFKAKTTFLTGNVRQAWEGPNTLMSE